MPIDAVDMATVVGRIEAAAVSRASFLISTPNLNFLVNYRSDPEFRESLLNSDLCPADGMPVVWIAKLIGVPIRARVSGSDVFDALKAPERAARPLKIFLFGGVEGAGEAAAKSLNKAQTGLNCVGTINPGFGTVAQMSSDAVIDTINLSGADFLLVSLGAKKGQLWLQRNHKRIKVPVRAHLGAVINFQAGTINRAPSIVRRLGFEWLWRITEEPYLWRRYWHDGCVFLGLLLTRVLPLAIVARWSLRSYNHQPQDLVIAMLQQNDRITISLAGDATEGQVQRAIPRFRETLTTRNRFVLIDFSGVRAIDSRFLGLLLMFRKQLEEQESRLMFVGLTPTIKRFFLLNELGYLLVTDCNGSKSS